MGSRRPQRHPIFVRFNSNINIPVHIDLQWNVARLKEEIAAQQGVDPTEIRIIFAGRELKDELKLKDAEIPNQSVVHAVRGGRWSARPGKGKTTPLSQVKLATVGEEQEDAGAAAAASPQRQAQYYVYCKTCKTVTPGKLRVCCSICKEGAIVLQQDPSRWDDVLTSGRMRGSCKTSGCDGDKAEFYFKCAMHPAAEGDRCVALNLMRSNTRDIPCLACTDVKDPVLVFPCADGHAVCLDCFEVYCTTKLNDRQFVHSDSYGYTLPCPGSSGSCNSALISEAHHFRVLSEDQYQRYHRFGTEEFVLKNGGVLCPGRGCGMGLLPEPGMRSVKCDGCKLEFCKECKEPFRRGHECHQNQSNRTTAARLSNYRVNAENARRARWEAEAKQVIEQISKKCPGCNTNTEKNGGCNHMTCSRCKFEWCWICLIHWNPECQGSHWFLQR
ncbi:E3 ubiquitin-protein ligase parkin-like [Orbicella faveolata]|uniref:E3 ubiquitin-protein ligase parkin-like n=1 Tax=Orbicella faveolata TaxID=48498 RepID=UPI0009E589D5|nr:E3 ubiquitin-protein ligase parkin-like [Orbicella faveolata]